LLDRTVTTNSNGYFATAAYGTAIVPGYSEAWFDAYNVPNYYNSTSVRFSF